MSGASAGWIGIVRCRPHFALRTRSNSWRSYLKPTSFRGRRCFATSDYGRVRFTTPATWVPGGIHKPDSVDALREVTRRFLGAYAPVAVEDLSRWFGGSRRVRGARMLAALGEEAVEV